MADEPADKKDDKVNPLQVTVDKLTKESSKYHDRAQTAEKERDDLKTRFDKIEADQKKATDEAEQAKLEGEGNYKEALENQKKTLDAETLAQSTRADTAESMLRNMLGRDALKDALGSAGVTSERISQAAQLLDSRVKVEFADGKHSVTIIDEAGAPMFAEGGIPATIANLVEIWLPSNLHFKPPTGDNGSNQKPGGPGTPEAVTRPPSP